MRKNKTIILLLVDLVIFYLSLYLALAFRYWEPVTKETWNVHQWPFFFINILWLFIFYVSGFYDIHIFSSFKKALERVLKGMAAGTIVATIVFYFAPDIDIAPKTNLFLHAATTTILLLLWRRFFWSLAGKTSKIKTLFLGNSEEIENLYQKLKNNPQYGYDPVAISEKVASDIRNVIKEKSAELVVASKNIMNDPEAARYLYQTIPLGITIADFPAFYESLTDKVPVSMINETWFLENLPQINKKGLSLFKRVFDIVCAVILGIPTLILFPFIALLSKIESGDKVLVRQERVGKNEERFTLVKFRSMYRASDGAGVWAKENDNRITRVGNILRKTRVDELPQIWNIFRGEMSFIGPRPERPKFVEELKKQIPHYSMRHLVKPGLTGWAQIKFPYGASVKDAMEKLQYDLYYIKNRSLVLELAIAAKTIFTMLNSEGR